MGRSKSLRKDRMYITSSEWMNQFGGKKVDIEKRPFKPLQYYCCRLSLQPFNVPVCSRDGNIYEEEMILKFLKKHQVEPVTGNPLTKDDLIYLKFHKKNGNFYCPSTVKEFTDYSHIVAIATSGNVYLYEAVEMLNIKPKSYYDILTNEPFTKDDIITIQDPNNYNYIDPSQYYYVKNGLMKKKEDNDPFKNITVNAISEQIFNEIKNSQIEEKKLKDQEKLKKLELEEKNKNSSLKTRKKNLGVNSASFTSSSFSQRTVEELVFEPKKTTKKGLISIVTNFGAINFVLHCDLAPLACENFLTHCEKNYYDNVIFHRSIKNFMIQGGDPTGTGRGGESIWGKDFIDEIKPELKHKGGGILSMANKGANTNGSQFYITYKSAPHLDGIHTIFGGIVGGMEILKQFERMQTDEDDRPIEKIVILQTVVYSNPFSEEELMKEEEEKKLKETKEKNREKVAKMFSEPNKDQGKGAVGKYLAQTNSLKRTLDFGELKNEQPKKKRKTNQETKYGDFSSF